MTISDDFQIARIRKYADLLKQQYELKERLGMINDELVNLAIFMTNDDINRANDLYKDLMEGD